MTDPPPSDPLPPSDDPPPPVADLSWNGEPPEVLECADWPDSGPPELPRPGFGHAVVWLLLFVVMQAIAGGLTALFFFRFFPSPAFPLCASTVTTFALAALIVRDHYGPTTRRMLGLRPIRASQLVLVVALTFPLAVLCGEASARTAKALGRSPTPVSDTLSGLQLPPDPPPASVFERMDQLFEALNRLPWVWALVFGALLPAVGEELLFRGFLGRGLVARHGPVRGVILTSMLFGLFHIDPIRIVSAAIGGVALHTVYLTTRSLVASILLHASFNALTIVAAKVWTAYQIDVTGLYGADHFPPWLVVASAGAVAAVGLALVRMRPRWELPDGSVWSPGYVSAESPPPHLGATARAGRLGVGAAAALAAALAVFAAAEVAALGTGQDRRAARRAIDDGNGAFARGDLDGAARAYSEAIRLAPDDAIGYANRGLAVSRRGDFAGALPDLDRAIALAPSFPDAYSYRARALAALGRAADARADLQTLTRLKPLAGVPPADQAAMFLDSAHTAVDVHDLGAGAGLLDRAIRLDPALTDAYSLRGFVHQQQGQLDQAISDYSAVLRRRPDDAYALGNRGICYLRRRQFDQAVVDLTAATLLLPEMGEYLVRRGEAYHAKGDTVRALADYTAALTRNPDELFALHNRARLRLGVGELDAAISDLTRFLGLNPAEVQVHIDRGDAYLRKNEFDHAIADFTAALRVDPKHVASYTFRGIGHVNKREFDKAIADYDAAIGIAPDFAAYANRAGAYTQKQDYDKAIADYDAALRLNPTSAPAYTFRGVNHAGKQDYDRAIADFTAAVGIAPDFAAHANRAAAYAQTREFEKAVADFTAALRFDPKSAFAYVGRAMAHKKRKDFGQALADHAAAVAIDPRYLPALNGQAWILATCPQAAHRDGKRAVELARTLCDLGGWKTGASLDTLAAAYAESGQYGEAVKWQEKALADTDFAKQYGKEATRRLQLYKENKPYREE